MYEPGEIHIPEFVQKRTGQLAAARAKHLHSDVRFNRSLAAQGTRYIQRQRRKSPDWYIMAWLYMAVAVCYLMLIFIGIAIGWKFLAASISSAAWHGAAADSYADAGFGPSQNGRAVVNRRNIPVPGWIIQDILPLNEYSRPGTKLDAVNGVVVHYTGNANTTAEQNRSYYGQLAQTQETKVSSHFVIGIDGKVIQCVPLDEVAYCSNERNSDTLSIECCHVDGSGKFSEATLDSLTKLLDWLADTYRLQRGQIIRHYDVTGKECPLYYVKYPDEWEKLLDTVTFSP